MPVASSPQSRGSAIADATAPDSLIEALPTLQRLALSYAPASSRELWRGLLALDTRLAGIVRAAREPMLAQLRLAWWREQFTGSLDRAPRGEPLLSALHGWDPERSGLATLVDGWEAFAATERSGGIAALAAARGKAIGALALLTSDAAAQVDATRMGEGWALADIAARTVDRSDRAAADALIAAHDWTSLRLPRALRPLAVLHGLAARAARIGSTIDAQSPAVLATTLRIGLLGR